MDAVLVILESTIYLLAIVGLLVLWLFHQYQVRTGRIQAVDLFDRSVERMYIYVMPGDSQPCAVCVQAHGSVFFPSQAGKKGFSPLPGACKGITPCLGFMVGLYGGWPEARDVVARLQKTDKKTIFRLTSAEISTVASGQWRRSVSAETDRASIHMLQGLLCEKTAPLMAVEGYRYVIAHAKDERHFLFVVPSYLRLIRLLIRSGHDDEARNVIEQLKTRVQEGNHLSNALSPDQQKDLQSNQALWWERQSLKVSA